MTYVHTGVDRQPVAEISKTSTPDPMLVKEPRQAKEKTARWNPDLPALLTACVKTLAINYFECKQTKHGRQKIIIWPAQAAVLVGHQGI